MGRHEPSRPRPERRRPAAEGFTLIELMITVTIIGLLSSVAIPGFMRYQRQARAVEVFESLEKIAAGAKLYYETPRTDADGGKDQVLPVSTGKTPAMDLAAMCAAGTTRYPDTALPDFDRQEWVNLLFRPGNGFRYRYEWEKVSNDAGVARAEGDLDCDGIHSVSEVHLTKGAPGEPLQREGVFWVIGDETE